MLTRPAALITVFVFIATTLSAQTPVAAYKPLSSGQRWEYYWHETLLSPGLYFAALGAAGGEQLAKDPPEWGQGVGGYARRAGTFLATYGIQATVHQGAAAALGYDPRYIHCECRGGGRRVAHAFVWSFLTKNGEGATRFNAPLVAGAYAGGMLPYLWYPNRYNPLKDGFREGSQEVGITVGVNLFREFSPELKRFFRLRPGP
jgi:hypothetical protein